MSLHYDLGDLSMQSPDERAQTILQKLRSERLYKPTHLYRGLMATPARLKTVLKHGTDRVKKNKYTIQPDEKIAHAAGQHIAEEVLRIEQSVDNDTNVVWVEPEAGLEKVISNYATADADGTESARPTVLVYDGKKLAWRGYLEAYNFKKGVKPLDALVAVFTFREF